MFWSILSRAVLAVVLFASGVAWDAPPVVISALLIGGSTVHLLWKAMRGGQLGHGSSGALPAAMETRLHELEERQYAEIGYLEEQSDNRAAEMTRRFAELEDRLEYAESTIARLRNTDQHHDPNRVQVMTPI